MDRVGRKGNHMAASWYVCTKSGEQGPFTSAKLKALAAAGKIRATTAIRREDSEQAVPAGRLTGLFPENDDGGGKTTAAAVTPRGAAAPASDAKAATGGRRRASGGRKSRASSGGGAKGGRPSGDFKSVTVLGWIVVALLVVVIAADVYSIFTMRAQVSYLEGILETGEIVEAEAEAMGDAGAISWLGIMGAIFLTGIVFVIWFHRSYKNLTALGVRRERGTGWAIGAWFVPLLQMYWPYLMGEEIRRRVEAPAKALLITWWILWLLPTTAIRLAFSIWGSDPDATHSDGQQILEAMRTDYLIGEIGIAVNALAAVAAILVVIQMSKGQEACAAEAAHTASS